MDKEELNEKLLDACYHDNLNIAEYLILEQNIEIGEDTMNFLIEDEYLDIIKMIETRDLKNKLNKQLLVKEIVKRNKI